MHRECTLRNQTSRDGQPVPQSLSQWKSMTTPIPARDVKQLRSLRG